MIDLSITPEAVLAGVDAVFLTHLHEDHWDEAARKTVASRHGTEEMLRTPGFSRMIDDTTGFFFERTGCRSVYLAGDTVWGPWVSATLARRRPGVIVLNTGNAVVTDFPQSIIMGAQDVLRATQEATDATVVAVHMDAINHCIHVHRDDLCDYLKA